MMQLQLQTAAADFNVHAIVLYEELKLKLIKLEMSWLSCEASEAS